MMIRSYAIKHYSVPVPVLSVRATYRWVITATWYYFHFTDEDTEAGSAEVSFSRSLCKARILIWVFDSRTSSLNNLCSLPLTFIFLEYFHLSLIGKITWKLALFLFLVINTFSKASFCSVSIFILLLFVGEKVRSGTKLHLWAVLYLLLI